MKKAFSEDAILLVIREVLSDPAYKGLSDVRNILTHRGTPGRSFFAHIHEGSDESEINDTPTQWQANDTTLDSKMLAAHRNALSLLISKFMEGTKAFITAHLSSL